MSSNQYKMIVSDYDRTLTNEENKVSDKNIYAIKDFISKGGIFAIATGRGAMSIKPILNLLGLNEIPVISSQGAIIHSNDNSLIYKKYFDNSFLLDVLKVVESYNVYAHIETLDRVFYNKKSLFSRYYLSRSGLKDNSIYCKSLTDYLKNNSNIEVFKLSLLCKKRNVFRIQKELNERFSGQIDFIFAGFTLLEATDLGASKGNAVHFLANKIGIKPKEIIVTGDSMNDLSMIDNEFTGIAVENAHKEIIKKAKHVTNSCNNNAIATIIEDFIH